MPGADKPGAAVPSAAKQRAAKPTKAGKKRKATLALMALAAVVLFGGGFLTATMTADPTASDEYTAMETTARVAGANRDAYMAQRDALGKRLAALEGEIKVREDSVSTREAALKTQEEGVKKREAAVSDVEKKKAANTVGDGTWVVGVDIEPGTYRPTENVGSRCYWGIYASGSNGDDIIANDIPGGGLPSVALAVGQDFKSSRCGTWTKQ